MDFVKIPDEQYFSDEALSQSGVKRILKAPAEFLQEQVTTDAMIQGKLIHALVLEPDDVRDYFAVFNGDRRTKAGKDEYAELSNSFCVVSQSVFDEAAAVAEAMRNHTFYGATVGDFLDHPGTLKEVALFWDQEFEFEGENFTVPCKCKFDAINPELEIILDLKSTTDASPDKFAKSVLYPENSGAYLQSAFYRMAAGMEKYRFLFLACEKKTPFCTGLYSVDPHTVEIAMEKITRAAWIYKQSMATGIWSSQYNDAPEELVPPGWFWMTQK